MVTDFIWVLCQGQIVGVKAEAWGLVRKHMVLVAGPWEGRKSVQILGSS